MMKMVRGWMTVAFTFFLLYTIVGITEAQVSKPGSEGLCHSPTQKVFSFKIPPLTQHFFVAGRRADGGAWSWGFNYPSTWRVTTNPANIYQADLINVGAEILITPDPEGITHGYRFLPPIQRRIITPHEALNSYVQMKFQNFRIRDRMDAPGMSIPGYQASTITIIYQAHYRGRPVEGILTTEVLNFPMYAGVATILAYSELQIAADLPVGECCEKLNSLIGIAMSARNVREIGEGTTERGWINTLGGLTEARDPRTGETFVVPFNYNYWWRDGEKLLGTNDPSPQTGTLLDLPTGGAFPRRPP